MSDETTVATAQVTTKAESTTEELTSALYPEKESKESVEVKSEEKKEASGTQEKPEEKVAEKVEGSLELDLPEETLLEASAVEELKAYAKEHNLSKEQAQKILEMQDGLLTGFNNKIVENFNNQIKSWGEEIKADKELGGENLSRSVELAKRAVKEFAGEEFLAELDQTGYGNHPMLFKMLVKIGSELNAKGLVLSNTQSNQPKSLADIFYAPSNN
jgi:hypothetical protein